MPSRLSNPRPLVLCLATLALLSLATSAFACPVCFGDSDDPIVKGVEASVLFMVGVTYFLLGGGVITFILLRRRAKRLAALQTALALSVQSR